MNTRYPQSPAGDCHLPSWWLTWMLLAAVILSSCSTRIRPSPSLTPRPSETAAPIAAPTPTVTPRPALVFPASQLSEEYLSRSGREIADSLDDLRRKTAAESPGSAEALVKALETRLGLQTALTESNKTAPNFCTFTDCFGKWWGKDSLGDFDLKKNPQDFHPTSSPIGYG